MIIDYQKLPDTLEEDIRQLIQYLKQFQPLLQQLAATPIADMTAREREVVLQLVAVIEPLHLIRDVLCNQAVYHAAGLCLHVEDLAETEYPGAQKASVALRPYITAGFVLTPYSMEGFLGLPPAG